MKIAVCISNVPDTTTRIKVASGGATIDITGIQWVMNPWDELALTRALELKEQNPQTVTEVVVVMAATSIAEPTLRKALAVGADRAVRLDFEPQDAYQAARTLADYFSEEPFDIIFTGIESADFNGQATGPMMAAIMNITLVPGVSGAFIENGKLLVNQDYDGNIIKLGVNTPAILVVQKGIAIVPRIPAMRGIMMARTKPLAVKSVTIPESFTRVKQYEPLPAKAAVKLIDPENPAELIELLRNEAKVI